MHLQVIWEITSKEKVNKRYFKTQKVKFVKNLQMNNMFVTSVLMGHVAPSYIFFSLQKNFPRQCSTNSIYVGGGVIFEVSLQLLCLILISSVMILESVKNTFQNW